MPDIEVNDEKERNKYEETNQAYEDASRNISPITPPSEFIHYPDIDKWHWKTIEGFQKFFTQLNVQH